MTTPSREEAPERVLLPCPFCGAADVRLVQAFTRATDDFAFWSIECLDCGCEIADDESQAKADAAWNTRADIANCEPSEGDVERVARALCELDIRHKRRHDTLPEDLEPRIPGAVDYHWSDYKTQALAAIQAYRGQP